MGKNHTTALYWEYDARLGRRWNVDPKPNPATSLYACFDNNPIWTIDPLGDTLRFVNNENNKGVLKELQKLTSDKLALAKDGKTIIIKKTRDTDANQEGTKLLRDLVSTDKLTQIYYSSATTNSTEGPTEGTLINEDGTPNTGNNAYVTWNNQKTDNGGVNLDGTKERPALIGLAHELFHARNRNKGIRARGISNVVDPDIEEKDKLLSNEELNTRKFENKIRSEQGITGMKQRRIEKKRQ